MQVFVKKADLVSHNSADSFYLTIFRHASPQFRPCLFETFHKKWKDIFLSDAKLNQAGK